MLAKEKLLIFLFFQKGKVIQRPVNDADCAAAKAKSGLEDDEEEEAAEENKKDATSNWAKADSTTKTRLDDNLAIKLIV